MADRRPPPRKSHSTKRRGPGPRPGGPARKPQRRRDEAHAATPQDAPRQGGDEAGERLQKVLAHAGVGSRRACEDLILQGRVTVDGQVVRELGTRVDPHRAKVAVDGQTVRHERPVYFAVHKPKGYVSTNSDPAGKPRVVDLLPEIPQRVYTVGRLDEQSTGLLLLTNDGEMANRLAHPKFGVEKIYRVVVAGEPAREVFTQLTEGIWLAEGKVRAKRVRPVGRKGNATVLEMVLAEGKNREIRRMLARLGHKVMSLTRIAVGPIGLKGLGVGECRPLTGFEVDLLRKVAAGVLVPAPRFPDRRPRAPRPQGPTRPASRPQAEAASQPPRPPRPAGPRRAPSAGRPAQAGAPRPEGRGSSAPPPRPRPPRPPGPGLNQGQGPARRPAGPAPTGGPAPAPARPKRPAPPREDAPTRRIIGLEPEAGARRPGPPGPRGRRPVPKRSPRAAFGIKRPLKDDETGEG